MTDPMPVPTCPWCIEQIYPGQDTAKVNGINWHAGCAEQREEDAYDSFITGEHK